MFYMSNDDMDDMMRKAADEYELNHEMASDWNKVQAGIQQPEQPFIVEPKQKKRKRYLLFLWFLLIPALILMYKINLFTASSSINQKKITETAITKKQFEKLNSVQQKIANKNAVYNNPSLNNSQPLNEKNSFTVGSENKNSATQKFSASNNSSPVDQNALTVNSSLFISQQKESNNNQYKSADKGSAAINNLKENKNDKQVINNADQTDKISKNSISQIVVDTAASTSTQTEKIKSGSPQKNVIKDSTVAASSKQKNKTSNYTRRAFAYAGIMANADVSFIKDQKTSSPGLGAGIIGGYHFKNGISVETGLVYDRKNYYTKGKYFNTGKLSYLQNVQLLATNGNCYMYEIPLNIQYDFATHKKYNWFVTAGASSYLMHKEYYNFKFDYNGTYGAYDYSYNHSSKNWFAILNIGAGINIQTSNKYFIRVQPYYKTPLHGVGIGSLPLSSAGINFSLIRHIP